MMGWRVQSKTLSEWKATLQSHLEKVATPYNNSRNENDSEGHTPSFILPLFDIQDLYYGHLKTNTSFPQAGEAPKL